jgi:hypothetical protein
MQKHSDPVRTRELRVESARMVGASDAIFDGRRNRDAPLRMSHRKCTWRVVHLSGVLLGGRRPKR